MRIVTKAHDVTKNVIYVHVHSFSFIGHFWGFKVLLNQGLILSTFKVFLKFMIPSDNFIPCIIFIICLVVVVETNDLITRRNRYDRNDPFRSLNYLVISTSSLVITI